LLPSASTSSPASPTAINSRRIDISSNTSFNYVDCSSGGSISSPTIAAAGVAAGKLLSSKKLEKEVEDNGQHFRRNEVKTEKKCFFPTKMIRKFRRQQSEEGQVNLAENEEERGMLKVEKVEPTDVDLDFKLLSSMTSQEDLKEEKDDWTDKEIEIVEEKLIPGVNVIKLL
jgi:hypothetical protein